MMKRLLSLLCLISCLCFSAYAGENKLIRLDKDSHVRQQITEIKGNRIIFELVSTSEDMAYVSVKVENVATDHAILIFGNNHRDNKLNKHTTGGGKKLKFNFKKTFPGKKGHRTITGCRELGKFFQPVIAAETATLLTVEARANDTVKLMLPFYYATYKSKDLIKRGKDNIEYKIMEEDINVFLINVKMWNESDSLYVSTKISVSDFINSLQGVKFCKNNRHNPPLEVQQAPYLEKKDSLINAINETIDYAGWMSDQLPHRAYSQLLRELNEVDLNKLTYDCRNHGGKPPHNCTYCQLSAQGIFHQLDKLYKQVNTKEIDRPAAAEIAKDLYNCYRYSNKRKKDSFYTDKISRFYNRIVK